MRKSIVTLLGCALTACLLIDGCKKPDDEPKCFSDGFIDFDVFIEGRYLRTVSCNPSNDEEFVFWTSGQRHTSPDNDTLFIYNEATGQTKQILVATMWYPPRWGRNGWILLGLAGGNLAMIKPDGDSLTNISQGRSYHHPAWNASCTRIYAKLFSGPDVLLTLDGTIVDTLQSGGGYVEFIDDDRFLIGPYIFTISTGQYDQISTGGGFSQMISTDEFISTGLAGIYKTNITTRQTVKLKHVSDSQIYMYPSVNASRTKVLWTYVKVRADTCGNNDLYEDYEIVEMNTDGTGEREIPIPE